MSVTFTTPTLETERLILRASKPSDFSVFARFFASERAQYVGGPKTEKDAWLIFCEGLGHWIMRGYGMFMVTRKGDDSPLGLVGHWHPSHWPETEMGWLLFDEKDEGQGIAFEAAQACVAHAWNELKWDSVVSYIDPRNTASIKLAERLGAWHDTDATYPDPLKPWGRVYRHPQEAA